MTINAKLLAIGEGFLILILCVLLTRTCQNLSSTKRDLKTSKQQVSKLKQDSTELQSGLYKCGLDAEKAKSFAYQLQQRQIRREAEVVNQVRALSASKQRVTAIKGLVENKSLPADRLRDTLTVVQVDTVRADSAVVAAVTITNQWLKEAQQDNDSLRLSVGTMAVAIQNKEQELTDCKDDYNELKRRYCRGFFGFFRRLFGKCN